MYIFNIALYNTNQTSQCQTLNHFSLHFTNNISRNKPARAIEPSLDHYQSLSTTP